jgi:thiosulfate sulfurtransferase
LEQIDIHKAKTLIEQGEITIVDVRDPSSFIEAHIDGAISLTDQNIENFLNKTDKKKPVLCYCYHGFSSQNAATYFLSNGFEKVYSMDGGFEEWRTTYPTVK